MTSGVGLIVCGLSAHLFKRMLLYWTQFCSRQEQRRLELSQSFPPNTCHQFFLTNPDWASLAISHSLRLVIVPQQWLLQVHAGNQPLPKLFCVPLLIKDNYDTVGMSASNGAVGLLDNYPTQDAYQVIFWFSTIIGLIDTALLSSLLLEVTQSACLHHKLHVCLLRLAVLSHGSCADC